MSIELGDKARDKLSGTAGIVVCVAHWLYGCTRVSIQPDGKTKDGEPKSMLHLDEAQCEIIKKGVHKSIIYEPVQETRAARPGIGGPARETLGFRR